jgi:hypothetical protein
MGRASEKFDRQLFKFKRERLSQEMQTRSVASDRKAGVTSRKTGGSFLLNVADGQLALLGEWLKGVDRICREVWQIQGEPVTADFVREILLPEALLLIGARESAVKGNIKLAASRMRAEDPHPAQHHLVMEIGQLKANVTNDYEIEARTLDHRNGLTQQALPPKRQHLLTAVEELEAEVKRSTVSYAQNSRKTSQGAESKPKSRKGERNDPEVAKRNALIRSNRDASAEQLCQIFDRESSASVCCRTGS